MLRARIGGGTHETGFDSKGSVTVVHHGDRKRTLANLHFGWLSVKYVEISHRVEPRPARPVTLPPGP
jgi:hypothetical protein